MSSWQDAWSRKERRSRNGAASFLVPKPAVSDESNRPTIPPRAFGSSSAGRGTGGISGPWSVAGSLVSGFGGSICEPANITQGGSRLCGNQNPLAGSALNLMDSIDREVLVLRDLEQLSNSETSQALDLLESAASKRYMRALKDRPDN